MRGVPQLRLFPLLVILALTLFFFWRIAFTGLIISGYDTFTYFYPYEAALASAVRHWRLPLWNPHVFLGAPLLANLQAAFFYPPTILFYLLPIPYALSISIMLHIFLATTFTYIFARKTVGLDRLAALAAGIAFGFSGFCSAQAGHINQLSAAAWLPLLLHTFDGAYKLGGLRHALLPGAVIALILLAGHSQEAYMALCTLGGYFLWLSAKGTWHALALGQPPGRNIGESLALAGRMLLSALKANLRGIGLLALTLITGGALAAVQLVPSLELAGLSIRSGGMTYRQAVSFSLNPLLLPQALLPGYWQNPFSEYVGYIGVVGLGLAFVGGLASWRRFHGGFFLALAGGGLLLALGGYTPLYLLGYALVPGFGLFRVPARWLYLYTFGAAMLAGLGMQALLASGRTAGEDPARKGEAGATRPGLGGIGGFNLRPSPWSPFWERLLLLRRQVLGHPVLVTLRGVRERVIVWLALGVAVLWAVHAFRLPAFMAWSVLAICTIALAILSRRAVASFSGHGDRSRPLEKARWPSLALLILLIADLFAASRDMEYNHPTAPEAFTALRPALAHLLADREKYRILSLSLGLFDPGDLADMRLMFPEPAATAFATASKIKEVLAPNTPMLFGIDSLDGYDGGILPLRRYVELQELFLKPWQASIDGRLREHLNAIPDGRLLSLLNVKYVITDKVHDVWVDNIYYDLGHSASLDPGNPLWQSGDLPVFPTGALGVVSYLSEATDIPDGTPIATITVTDQGGRSYLLTLRAGVDTAEGEYKATVRHRQARVVSAWRDNPQGKNYHTLLLLGETTIPRSLQVRYIARSGRLVLRGISLVDDRTGIGQSLVVSDRGRFALVHTGDVKLYRNLDVLPRAFVVHRAQVMRTNRAVLDILKDPAFVPTDYAPLVADGLDMTPLANLFAAGKDEVLITEYAPERVTIQATLGGNGLLVLADMWYPGWQAYVDGREQPIYRVYHVFRGVYVPAGTHKVEFIYCPISVLVGGLISAVALVGIGLFSVWAANLRERCKRRPFISLRP